MKEFLAAVVVDTVRFFLIILHAVFSKAFVLQEKPCIIEPIMCVHSICMCVHSWLNLYKT